MTSNIRLRRICGHCQQEFTAKTTVTKYCSDICAKRAYKARIRKAKIEQSNKETHEMEIKPIQDKEFLTIAQACKLLSISRWTIWRAVNRGELKAGKIGRRVILRRADLDRIFK